MYHIIDADKLLEFVEAGMRNSKLCAGSEPVTQSVLYVTFMGGVIGYLIGKYWKNK